MKQAGLKNDGAWYRMNAWLKLLRGRNPENGVGVINGILQSTDGIADYVAALNDIDIQTGAALGPMTAVSLCDVWAQNGIPRQVWKGVLTFDTYITVDDKKVPAHWREAMVFGYNLRRHLTQFRRGYNQLLDVQNAVGADAGNPGGIADADIET